MSAFLRNRSTFPGATCRRGIPGEPHQTADSPSDPVLGRQSRPSACSDRLEPRNLSQHLRRLAQIIALKGPGFSLRAS